MKWKGVIPAITTCFNQNLTVDQAYTGEHCVWMIESGCSGVVALGSLGEGATLSYDEKLQILSACVRAIKGRAPVVAAISSLTTSEAVSLAKAASDLGCEGLMVLPPYVYQGDWREMKAHVAAIFQASPLSCMLYNNPVAYGTDFLPEHIAQLAADYANLEAVKESSTDARRVAAIRALLNDRLSVLVGVDDAVIEAIGVGASGWIAGLANALPHESVELFNSALNGERDRAFELYRWFLPLLRMDTVPKFVQLIKLVQSELGRGNARVRPPRLQLEGRELENALKVIRTSLQSRPEMASAAATVRK